MKKRRFNFNAQVDLVGMGSDLCRENINAKKRLIREDIKYFKMGVAEIADTCQSSHIFPYDLLPKDQVLADKVIDELLRRRESKMANAERTK